LTPSPVPKGDLLTLLPNFLTDPNTACAIYRFNALSCLDRDGRHVYGADAFKAPYFARGWIAQYPSEHIYLSMGFGLYMIKDRMLMAINAGEVHSSDYHACGLGDEIWVGDLVGVSHFDGSAWTNYPSTDMGSSDSSSVDSIAVAPDGKLWVSMYDCITTFDGTN
jgi:hypothetical protein